MKKNRRKILSILLAVAMVVTTYHVPTHAAGNDKITEKLTDKVSDQIKRGVEKDGSYLNVPKLGDREEEEAGEIKPVDLSEVLRVSIVLDKPGTIEAGYSMQNIAKNGAAMSYRNSLKAQQKQLTARIEQVIGKKLDVKWNITLGANIISANMTRGDMIKIAAVSGVKKLIVENLYEAPVVEPNTTNTPGMIGIDIDDTWAGGYYGAGSKIMIIDTGTNQDHLSFSGDALEYALTLDGKSLDDYDLLTQADVAAVASQLNAGDGLDAAKAYKSLKIPFAYNYVDGNYTTDHSADTQSEHGSHVSGISAANRYVKVNGEYVSSLEAVLACGVAPDAQILTAKVFGAAGGAYDSDYFVAIEDAIILGCDAVNLSLGSAVVGFAFSDEYQDIMDSLTDEGLVMVTSAGNSYGFNNAYEGRYGNTSIPYNYIEDINLSTNGSPGSFINTLSVASAENVGYTDTPLVFNGEQNVFYWESTLNNQKTPPIPYGNPEIKSIAGTYDYVFIDGYGAPEEYAAVNSAISLEGKVVMVFRGGPDPANGISFVDKANDLIEYKPAALIVVNNQEGEIYMSLSDQQGNNLYEGDFPMVAISLENGLNLIDNSAEAEAGDYYYYTGSVEIKTEVVSQVVADAPSMSDFSSWGGAGSLLLKPEITAPGGNVYSVNGMTNDGYENMSGTSMAAPQVTGMMALFGEYYRDSLKESVDAAFPNQFSERQLAHSLLMSTAVPMIEEDSGTYYPILRQGSGLGNIGNAVAARSFIMMEDDATVSAADGKVKAELGQSISGKYTYSFTIYNPSDTDLLYDLSTDLFTQGLFGYSGLIYLDEWAADMDGEVKYTFEKSTGLHDVDKDGDTDTDDVQAILDYLSGERDGSDLDLSTPVADLDEDGKVTSYDAVLLLNWLYALGDGEDGDTVLVPAGDKKTVTVDIDVSSWQPYIDYYFTSGMWVEGYTFVTCTSTSDDGALLDVEHSIPLLGFMGSFTDASMYDVNSYTEALYGNKKMTYGDDPYTNYMLLKYPGAKKATIFTGNPYAVEDEFPSERLAISSNTLISAFHYDLIRAAGSTGLLVREADEDRNVTDTIVEMTLEGEQYPDFFHTNEGQWIYQYGRVTASVEKTPADLGLKEGDVFNISRYAIPEYYAMQLNDSTASALTGSELEQLLTSTDDKTALGEGAFLGFTLKVDDTSPTIEPLKKDGDDCTVTFYDNQYVAYVALLDPSCSVTFEEMLPEQTEEGQTLSLSFKASDYADFNAVAIFVADYAGNESAVVVKVSDGPIQAMGVDTIYIPAETFVEGKQYVIADSNVVGKTNTLLDYDTFYYAGNIDAVIEEGSFDEYEGIYIPSEYVYEESLWTPDFHWGNYVIDDLTGIEDSFVLFNLLEDDPVYLFNHPNLGLLTANGEAIMSMFESSYVPLTEYMIWGYDDSELASMAGGSVAWLEAGYFDISDTASKLYLYEPIEITSIVPYDPYVVNEITVDPAVNTLIPSVGLTTVQLTATVEPLTAEDRSVSWSSSDESIATVDSNGLVTAVSIGTVTITATANDESGVSGSALVNIVEQQPMDAEVYAQVAFGKDDIRFVKIDLNDMSVTTEGEAFSAFYGGGRSGDYVYGNDADNDFHRFKITDDYAYDNDYHFVINKDYALIDIASFPAHTLTFGEGENAVEVPFVYDFAGFSADGKWEIISDKIRYFTLGDYGNFVAAAFGGVTSNYVDEDGDTHELALIYYFLTDDGTMFVWFQYGTATGGFSAEFYQIGYVNALAFTDEVTAYSMTYSAANKGVFIGDNTTKSIYFVSLAAMDLENEETKFNAVFVGPIDGATNISSLYNADYDAVTSLNSVRIELPEGRKAVAHLDSVVAEDAVNKKAENTLEAPVEEVTETPAEEEPAEEVTEAPAEEEPAEEVTEAPAEEEPAEEVTEAPAEEEPAEEVTEAPAEEEPAEEVTEAPAEEEPAEEVTEAPAEAEAEAPAEEATEAPTEAATEAPTEAATETPSEPETEAPAAEEPAEEVTEAPAAEEPANPVVGGLNAVVTRTSAKSTRAAKPEGTVLLTSALVTETDNEDSVLLSLTDEEDVTNGIVTVTYDPETLEFVGVTNPTEAGADVDDFFYSAHHDEEAGTVTFVYAVRTAVEAGEELAELEFKKPCEDSVILVATSERNQEQDLEESSEEELEGTGHDWKLDSVEWEGNDNDGYTKATFTFICQNNNEHVKIEVDEELEVTSDDEDGSVTYKASVVGPDGETYGRTERVEATTPNTGDVSNLPLFVTMGSAATAALVGVVRIHRKKEDEEE